MFHFHPVFACNLNALLGMILCVLHLIIQHHMCVDDVSLSLSLHLGGFAIFCHNNGIWPLQQQQNSQIICRRVLQFLNVNFLGSCFGFEITCRNKGNGG